MAVVLSAASIVRILRSLRVQASRTKWVLGITLFLPAAIIYTSGTLREAFQQLFLLLTFELSIKLIDAMRGRTVFWLMISTLLGGSPWSGGGRRGGDGGGRRDRRRRSLEGSTRSP